MRSPLAAWVPLAVTLLLGGCAESMMAGDGGPTDAGARSLPDAGPLPDGAPERLGAPYPVVLAHGFFGFNDFAGLGFIDYFWRTPEYLAEQGEELVFTPAIDPFNNSEVRGELLIARIEEILAETGHAKVNLIGHSQGGIDARYVAAVRPDLVASVTMYAAPNRGTEIIDVVLGLLEDRDFRALIDAVVRVIGAPIYDEVGEETSIVRSLEQLSAGGMTSFNERFPNHPDVAYYSVAGRTGNDPGGQACRVTNPPDFMRPYSDMSDPVDPLLGLMTEVSLRFGAGSTDGMVAVASARWGRFLGCIPADHLDQIGQLFGDSPGRGNRFDHRVFLAELIAWLRTQGH